MPQAWNKPLQLPVSSPSAVPDGGEVLESPADLLLRVRQQQLALDRAKNEFITLASHQLRTPATGVKQYLGMILDGYAGEISDLVRSFLVKAYDANERELALLNQIINVANIDSGNVRLHSSLQNVCEVVKSV